ncbi:hypothetical protein BV22DRAFT_933963 [Leucogyrophana mollusca]|uniref:Uncharacterized protein n=1 Tax=Leucogyrophana mollusca TaxID=85980 RepID=A0ACB8AWG4_9AGAM|nr:hypothetical protein BV22DRAFT_933963 [Leucogyrophana mollusca]
MTGCPVICLRDCSAQFIHLLMTLYQYFRDLSYSVDLIRQIFAGAQSTASEICAQAPSTSSSSASPPRSSHSTTRHIRSLVTTE